MIQFTWVQLDSGYTCKFYVRQQVGRTPAKTVFYYYYFIVEINWTVYGVALLTMPYKKIKRNVSYTRGVTRIVEKRFSVRFQRISNMLIVAVILYSSYVNSIVFSFESLRLHFCKYKTMYVCMQTEFGYNSVVTFYASPVDKTSNF